MFIPRGLADACVLWWLALFVFETPGFLPRSVPIRERCCPWKSGSFPTWQMMAMIIK